MIFFSSFHFQLDSIGFKLLNRNLKTQCMLILSLVNVFGKHHQVLKC